jgi:hypothetical protein
MDEHHEAMTIEQLHKSWNSITYEEIEESTGFYFTLKMKEVIGNSLDESDRPRYTTSSCQIFTKEEIVTSIDNPYSVMRGMSRLIGHKMLLLTVDTLQFKLTANNFLTASVTFNKQELNAVHGGIGYKMTNLVFPIMPNASIHEFRNVRSPKGFDKLSVAFSLKDLSVLIEPKNKHNEVTGEMQMMRVLQPSPINAKLGRSMSRLGQFATSGAKLLGPPKRPSFNFPSLSESFKGYEKKKEDDHT